MSQFELGGFLPHMEMGWNSTEYQEFSEALDRIKAMTGGNDFYLEEVDDAGSRMRKGRVMLKANTVDTTKNMVYAYDNLTTAGATLINGVWNIVMDSITLMSKVISFVVKKVSVIPGTIIKVGDQVSRIPGDTLTKIRGDITLHITANDIEMLYNSALMQRLDTYVSLATELSKGDVWKTMFNFSHIKTQGLIHLKDNDMKRCRQMESIYTQLKAMNFKPTRIDMSDANQRAIYFGGNQSIKFTDLHGKQHTTSYYNALRQLCFDVQARQKDLEALNASLGEKYTRTQMNSAFSHVGKTSQDRIISTLRMTTHIVGLIGNIVRSIMTDIVTIEKACGTIHNGKVKRVKK